MSKKYKLENQRFGRLLVLYENGRNEKGQVLWHCKCDCGNEKDVITSVLVGERVKSCGCLGEENKQHLGNISRKYGEAMKGTRLYSIWTSMKNRCNNPNNSKYKNYGGRGIKVCEEWVHEFAKFRAWALENDYSDVLTLDRINVNGNYEPSNCRWATIKEQAWNKQNTIYITYNNEKRTLIDWSERLNINYNTIRRRYKKGWSDKEIIEGRGK